MKKVLLTSIAMLVFAGSAQARSFDRDESAEPCLFSAQLLRPDEDDDDEVWRPGPRGEDGEPIETGRPGWRTDDDDNEVPERPGAPSDDDDDE